MISVDCNFPGGNIIVDGIDGDTIRAFGADLARAIAVHLQQS